MKLYCYPTSSLRPRIRPAPRERGWMDRTDVRYAYRCLPLAIANAHGWEVLCQGSATLVWDGGNGKDAVKIHADGPERLRPISHFGYGVVTFHVHALFRSEPGHSLWVSGPTNRPKDAIAPLTGVVETDWSPYTFTMNWKFTRPHTEVTFEEGEPFCFFFPLRHGEVELVEPEYRDLAADQAVAEDYRIWSESRRDFNRGLRDPAHEGEDKPWQKNYFRGEKPDRSKTDAHHLTKVTVKGFE